MRLLSIAPTAAFAAVLSIVAACGGNAPDPTTPTTPTATASTTSDAPAPTASATSATPPAASSSAPTTDTPPTPTATAIDWKGMTHEQKIEHMKKVVTPKMTAVFQGFDAKRYEKMSCKTCHGEGAMQGKFQMPNPALPKLSMAGGFKKHMDSKPEVTKFMMQKVVPEMAAALGMQPYDASTHQGFGCGGCHVMVK